MGRHNTYLRKKINSFKKHSVKELIIRVAAACYKKVIRKALPSVGFIYYSDIKVSKDKKPFDSILKFPFIPNASVNKPTYEKTLINELKKHVKANSKVVIIGAGVGITAVVADQLISDEGTIICYESSFSQYNKANKTFRYNNVSENTSLVNATVAANIGVYNEGSSNIIAVNNLPECDILQLDCEGAERLILQDMTFSPKVVIVETHGVFGAPTTLITKILINKGYSVEKIDVAEPRIYEQCVEKDIYILTAVLDEDYNS